MFPPNALTDFLYATHNMAPHVEPETADGQNMTDAAIEAMQLLSFIARQSPAHAQGALIAATLFVEVMASDNPVQYMKEEGERAHDSKRHEFHNANIRVVAQKMPKRPISLYEVRKEKADKGLEIEATSPATAVRNLLDLVSDNRKVLAEETHAGETLVTIQNGFRFLVRRIQ